MRPQKGPWSDTTNRKLCCLGDGRDNNNLRYSSVHQVVKSSRIFEENQAGALSEALKNAQKLSGKPCNQIRCERTGARAQRRDQSPQMDDGVCPGRNSLAHRQSLLHPLDCHEQKKRNRHTFTSTTPLPILDQNDKKSLDDYDDNVNANHVWDAYRNRKNFHLRQRVSDGPGANTRKDWGFPGLQGSSWVHGESGLTDRGGAKGHQRAWFRRLPRHPRSGGFLCHYVTLIQ